MSFSVEERKRVLLAAIYTIMGQTIRTKMAIIIVARAALICFQPNSNKL
jgi:hypothetical protein